MLLHVHYLVRCQRQLRVAHIGEVRQGEILCRGNTDLLEFDADGRIVQIAQVIMSIDRCSRSERWSREPLTCRFRNLVRRVQWRRAPPSSRE